MFLVYGGAQLKVERYCDASFQMDKDDNKSQSGFVFLLNGRAISWKSSKQETTTDSTIEAKYISASDVAKLGVWIMKFIRRLRLRPFGFAKNKLFVFVFHLINKGILYP